MSDPITDPVVGLLSGNHDSGPVDVVVVIGVVIALALVATRISRFMIRRVIRRIATRALVGRSPSQSGLWRTRARRVEDENGDLREQRRRQRIDAASRMVSHLSSVAIWLLATIAAFHLLDVNPAFFLSSAGFIGAGLAIGGQHKVNDYLTGLSVHFEDRYGVGDEISADVGAPEPIHGVVDHIGLFSTRIRDARSSLHVANHSLVNVRNLSQEAATSMLRLHVPAEADPDDAASLLRGLAGTHGLTDVVFVGDLDASADRTGEVDVAVHTTRTLDDRAKVRLVQRTERALFERGLD